MGLKKKILQMLLRRWLRSNINGLCILTFITIFLYVIYFVCFYLVFMKRNIENESENGEVFIDENATIFNNSFWRYFTVSSPSEVKKTSYNLSDRDSIRKYLNTILKDGLRRDRGSVCEPPTLKEEQIPLIEEEEEADDDTIVPYLPKLVCSTVDWVECYKSECKVVKDILDTTENITCNYREVFYYVNGSWRFGNWTAVTNNGTYVLNNSDYVSINCVGLNLDGLFETTWYGRQVGIRNQTIKEEGNQNGSVNILLLGFGCGSRMEFTAKLPKTYKILTKKFNATILNGFTSLGGDFISSLFPILTGRNELEFVDTRRRINSYKMSSGWFIFSSLEEIGYSTAFYEDFPTTFSRLHGYNTWPAHHYNHPFLMHIYSRNKKPCLGDTSVYDIFMNLTHQFMYSSSKTFAFTFISSACGQNAQIVDDAALKLLESLEGGNNIVIVFGTKGGSPRQPNKNSPFAAVIVPPLKSHPDVQTALQANANAVTTPYDIHATLLDAVGLTEYWGKIKVEGSKYFRGMSVLRPIPLNRICSDAAILPEWCTCQIFDHVTKIDNLYMTLAHAFVSYVNTLTIPVRERCASLILHSINWMKKQRVNMKLVTYNGSVDRDGYVARFDNRIRNPEVLYKMQVVLNPAGAIFEARASYLNLNGTIMFDEKSIVRIDDNKTYCILPTHPQLIKYCYCK